MLQARSTVNGSETQQDRDDFLFYFLRPTSKTTYLFVYTLHFGHNRIS